MRQWQARSWQRAPRKVRAERAAAVQVCLVTMTQRVKRHSCDVACDGLNGCEVAAPRPSTSLEFG